MDDPEVVAAVWAEGGLDVEKLLEMIQTSPIKDALKESAQAADRSVFGVPTFFVSDEMFFGKEPGPDRGRTA